MSFGYSVGDFIAVLRLANEVRKRFVDAPVQFKTISEEWARPTKSNEWILNIHLNSVKVLSNVLRDVDDILPERDLTSRQKKELDEVAQACYDILQTLQETLDKFQELDSSVKGISGKPRRVWKRLKWDQRDIDQFQSRITLNISAFNMFLGRLTR